MATLPHFKHIHCSSRFDRSAQSLDFDLAVWQQVCSLITLTEVSNDNRAAQMRAKGWAYYNAVGGSSGDDGGICWDADIWKCQSRVTRKLSAHPFTRAVSHNVVSTYSVSVVLKHVSSGHKLLVTVSHFPAHIEGHGGFRTDLDQWQGRKQAYMSALTNWHHHVEDLVRKKHCDGALVIADWNINLKAQWFRDILKQKFGKDYIIAWRDLPTSGGALHGGPDAPAGSSGQGHHDRIIDGTLYRGLKIKDGPHLMSRAASSDHRPYHETFSFKTAGEKDDKDDNGQGAGAGAFHGPAWWGFGDYMDDEMYDLTRATGDTGGEVL